MDALLEVKKRSLALEGLAEARASLCSLSLLLISCPGPRPSLSPTARRRALPPCTQPPPPPLLRGTGGARTPRGGGFTSARISPLPPPSPPSTMDNYVVTDLVGEGSFGKV